MNMTVGEQYLKELEAQLKGVTDKLREDLRMIRGNRPSVDIIDNIKVNYYEQDMTIKQLGSLSVIPPRSVQISVWDKNTVGPVMKAIENAKIGLSVSNDGNNIIATLSPLMAERKEELIKLIGKTSENFRIQVRSRRDDAIKKIKDSEEKGFANEDDVFRVKEGVQKLINGANKQIEEITENKISEFEN